MKSQKSIWRRIIEWFSDNTWIYGATITIAICGVLAFLSISLGKEKADGNNMFIGGRYWPIKSESSTESVEESVDSSEDSSVEIVCSGEHVWIISSVKEPTCTGYGATRYKCALCGDTSKKPIAIQPLGHDIVDGVCTRCGKAE